ncbi:OmpA family protein [Micromonospora sp. STR1s_5]|nr:OmpA family protein [Micromonospora sp. STR1s_5]
MHLLTKELSVFIAANGIAAGVGGIGGDILVNEGKVNLVDALGMVFGGVAGHVVSSNKTAIAKVFQSNAKGVLAVAGFNFGLQLTAGATGGVGLIWKGSVPVLDAPIMPPIGPEQIDTPVRLTAHDSSNVLVLPSDVLFGFDRSDLNGQAGQALAKAAETIRLRKPRRAVVRGFTDSVGSAHYNVGLSKRRAEAVASWLIKKGHLDQRMVETVGMGEFDPIMPNRLPNGADNPAGRVRNRRVEIVLVS